MSNEVRRERGQRSLRIYALGGRVCRKIISRVEGGKFTMNRSERGLHGTRTRPLLIHMPTVTEILEETVSAGAETVVASWTRRLAASISRPTGQAARSRQSRQFSLPRSRVNRPRVDRKHGPKGLPARPCSEARPDVSREPRTFWSLTGETIREKREKEERDGDLPPRECVAGKPRGSSQYSN